MCRTQWPLPLCRPLVCVQVLSVNDQDFLKSYYENRKGKEKEVEGSAQGDPSDTSQAATDEPTDPSL